jgi:hypothetical protein
MAVIVIFNSFTFVWVFATFPEHMQKNQMMGTTIIADTFCCANTDKFIQRGHSHHSPTSGTDNALHNPLMQNSSSQEEEKFCFFSDMMIGLLLFSMFALGGSVISLYELLFHYDNWQYYVVFLSALFFVLGMALFSYSSSPDNAVLNNYAGSSWMWDTSCHLLGWWLLLCGCGNSCGGQNEKGCSDYINKKEDHRQERYGDERSYLLDTGASSTSASASTTVQRNSRRTVADNHSSAARNPNDLEIAGEDESMLE